MDRRWCGMADGLLAISGLAKAYRGAPALRGVDLAVGRGETVALVGGSGSGKTTLARIVARLVEPDAGRVTFDGMDVLALRGEALRRWRARLQMVFQDPLAALNPLATVGRLLTDPLRIHNVVPREDHAREVARLLERVGLSTELVRRHPHEISGGQRQRVNIARALASKPDLVVLDEPVSSLDVSVRARVLDLLREIQRDLGIAYLFISHDLAVVRAVADRVAVLDGGVIVEQGATADLFAAPQHATTRALIDAVPRLPRRIEGEAA
jgi:peptide/nickel transport system ATP-binding protein